MRKQMNLLDESNSASKVIWYLAWPTVLEQLLLTLVQYVDTAMVGSLGANATASIAVTSSSSWLVNGIFAAIAIGFAVPVGSSIGANQPDRAKAVIRQAVLAIPLIGLAMTLIVQLVAPHLPGWLGADMGIRTEASAYLSIVGFAYMFNLSVNICSNILRCSGDTRTPLIFNVLTNVINVALNFLFIFEPRTVEVFGQSVEVFGFGMGVQGAALATAIATAFSGLMLLRSLFRKSSPVAISLSDKFRLDGAIWRDMVRLGSPVAGERITLSSGQIAMTAMVTGLGNVSLAAHHLAITAEALTYMPAFGFSAAATTLVAQSLGANRPDLAKKFGKYCVGGGVIFMTAMGVVLFLAAEFLISIFSPDAAVVTLGGSVLRIEAFAQPFFALSMVVFGVLRGAGDTKWPFFISAIGMWAIRLPLAFGLSQFTTLALTGAWIAMVSDLFSRGIFAFIRFRSGKWCDGRARVHSKE